MRVDEGRERVQIVATLEHGHQAALADLEGDFAQPLPPSPEAFSGDSHAAERIPLPIAPIAAPMATPIATPTAKGAFMVYFEKARFCEKKGSTFFSKFTGTCPL